MLCLKNEVKLLTRECDNRTILTIYLIQTLIFEICFLKKTQSVFSTILDFECITLDTFKWLLISNSFTLITREVASLVLGGCSHIRFWNHLFNHILWEFNFELNLPTNKSTQLVTLVIRVKEFKVHWIKKKEQNLLYLNSRAY